jgi:hypothetical protein
VKKYPEALRQFFASKLSGRFSLRVGLEQMGFTLSGVEVERTHWPNAIKLYADEFTILRQNKFQFVYLIFAKEPIRVEQVSL